MVFFKKAVRMIHIKKSFKPTGRSFCGKSGRGNFPQRMGQQIVLLVISLFAQNSDNQVDFGHIREPLA